MAQHTSAPTAQRILEELRVRGPMTATGLGTLLPFSNDFIHDALLVMRRDGTVRYDPLSNRYDYVPQPTPAPASNTLAGTPPGDDRFELTRRDHAAHAMAAAILPGYPRNSDGVIDAAVLAASAYLIADALEKAR